MEIIKDIQKEATADLFDKLYLRSGDLSTGQIRFIDSCKQYLKKRSMLSPEQIKILKDMLRWLPAPEIRTTNKPL